MLIEAHRKPDGARTSGRLSPWPCRTTSSILTGLKLTVQGATIFDLIASLTLLKCSQPAPHVALIISCIFEAMRVYSSAPHPDQLVEQL